MEFDDILDKNIVLFSLEFYCKHCKIYRDLCKECRIFTLKNKLHTNIEMYQIKECSQCYISDCKDCTVYANYSKLK